MKVPKLHRERDPYARLNLRFRQVVGTVFDLMLAYSDYWKGVKWSKPTALFGIDGHEMAVPAPVEVNMAHLHERFLRGFEEYEGFWREIFDQTAFNKLQEIRHMGLAHFSFPSQTWATMLFDAAIAYRHRPTEHRTQIVDSLLPLYLGKVVSYVKRTERMSLQQAEEHIENACGVFEECKPYLIERWH
ncbi:MAG: hypothetical protein D6722_29090 [Bacteroidetes bacterium]|nr:MAG: hypothetical protein D6722_29090 [Bacteroidota bacterium]